MGVCTALRRDDKIVSTHRGHGHTIAKGADLKRMMAELFGRSNGYCHGKGGSMHIADFSVGMRSEPTASVPACSIATGAALGAVLAKSDGVAVAFGDGASMKAPSTAHSTWLRSGNSPPFSSAKTTTGPSLCQPPMLCRCPKSRRASAYNIPGVTKDGTDVLAVYEAAAQAVQRHATERDRPCWSA